MKTLVTGGNGFLGRAVVAALLARGESVRVLALPNEDTSWLTERGVEVWRGNVAEAACLPEVLDGLDCVIHLAAMLGAWRPLAEYEAVNVRGTENVCRAAQAAGVARLLHVSSAMVYDMAHGRPATEEDPLAPLDEPYCQTKAAADQLVQRLIREEGLPATIIRPGTLYGPGDRVNFGRIADRLIAGKGLIIGSGRNTVPFVYIDDLVRGLLLALDSPAAVGQVYNLGDDRAPRQGDVLRAIAAAVGAAEPRRHVPYTLLYAAGYAAEWLARASSDRIPPIVTRHGVKLYGADNRLSIEKARRDLGYEPEVRFDDGIQRAAAWYRQQQPSVAGPAVPLSTLKPLANRVALVTGASSGIGAATARELARLGATVVLSARRAPELAAECQAIEGAGGRALAIEADITEPESVARLMERAHAECGPLDILISNAGVGWPRPMAETTSLDIERVVRVNLSATMHLTNAVVPAMVARGRGTVVIVGSVQSRVPVDPLYTATKFGLRGYALALRRQLLGSGVAVSLVLPGNTRTAMTSHLRGRLAEPNEIARVIAGLVMHPRREAIVPGRYRAIIWLDALAPWLADALYLRRISARRSIAATDSPRHPMPFALRGKRKGVSRWKH